MNVYVVVFTTTIKILFVLVENLNFSYQPRQINDFGQCAFVKLYIHTYIHMYKYMYVIVQVFWYKTRKYSCGIYL